MMLRRLLLASTFAGLGWKAAAAPATDSTQTGSDTHVVRVGIDHKFDPEIIIANVGDIITFEFFPLNHSVVRMDPKSPCKPWEMLNPKQKDKGWWSGFHYMPTIMDNPPTYNITVSDTDPIYFYCSAIDSCIKFQMVGAVNPDNTTNPLITVQDRASKTKFSLNPGEPWPAEGEEAPPESSNTASSTPSSSDSSSSLSPGVIAGIVIGSVIAIALIGLLFFFIGRKKKSAEVKAAAKDTGPAPGDSLMSQQHMSMVPGEQLPGYTDPRYSGISAAGWDQNTGMAKQPMSENPHRVSELGAQNYDPVEIYTPSPDSPTRQ